WSAKARRGLRGLGLRDSIGTLRWVRGRSRCAASPPTSPIRLARPRPSRERISSAIASSLELTPITPELQLVSLRLHLEGEASDRRVGKAALHAVPTITSRGILAGTLRCCSH